MRRLMLLRHAKTETDAPSGRDQDRRLDDRGRNDAAAYAWINFTMRPENAARVIKSVGSFSAANNTAPLIDARLKAQFAAASPNGDLKSIHWYPAIPPGLEELEGRVLDRVKAAN